MSSEKLQRDGALELRLSGFVNQIRGENNCFSDTHQDPERRDHSPSSATPVTRYPTIASRSLSELSMTLKPRVRLRLDLSEFQPILCCAAGVSPNSPQNDLKLAQARPLLRVAAPTTP